MLPVLFVSLIIPGHLQVDVLMYIGAMQPAGPMLNTMHVILMHLGPGR